MSTLRRIVVVSILVVAGTLLLSGCGKPPENQPGVKAPAIKIGFVNPKVDEPWFRDEHKFARLAAAEKGFDVVTLSAADGATLMSVIDNLGSQGAQGVIICPPDVKLGPAIVQRCKDQNLKLMTVDDQLEDKDGKTIDSVPHTGINAHNIGRMVGEELWKEMQNRKWKIEDTAALAITWDQVLTSRLRTDGAEEVLVEHGFPKAKFYRSPAHTDDVPGGLDAGIIMMTQHQAEVKHWLICSQNDEGVLGAVRATEGARYKAEDVIGIGIGGATGKVDFQKEKPTGFFGSIMIKPKLHGHDTSVRMYEWIKNGTVPKPLELTDGELITRDNYAKKLADEGIE